MANPIKIKCTVSSISYHDENVSTVRLKPERKLPNFKPGQFLHLALDPYDPTLGFWPESRVFSIASTPFDPEITITYVIKGSFTLRMRKELLVGKDVWTKLPYGHFTLTTSEDKEVMLIAGGTGITPFVSFLSFELVHPSGTYLTLVYGVKNPERFIFKETILKALSTLKGFKLFAFSEEIFENLSQFSVEKGMLTMNTIWQASRNPKNAIFYLSGPQIMINKFKNELIGRKVKLENIHIDEWE